MLGVLLPALAKLKDFYIQAFLLLILPYYFCIAPVTITSKHLLCVLISPMCFSYNEGKCF